MTVDVRLPDGTDVEYLLEPAALAGGRLRARDRRADIERTLPLSSITAVGSARWSSARSRVSSRRGSVDTRRGVSAVAR